MQTRWQRDAALIAAMVSRARAVVVFVLAVVAGTLSMPMQAHAGGSVFMDPNCWNSTTWDNHLIPYAKPSKQSVWGCFETTLEVVDAQCRFLVAHGNASQCELYSPPAPLTDITAQTSGTNHATGGTQGEAYWGVNVMWYGVCPEHSVSKGGLECGCVAGYGPDGAKTQCVPVSVVALANSQPCNCAGGPVVANPIVPLRGVKRETVDLGFALAGMPLTLSYDSSDAIPKTPAESNDGVGADIVASEFGRPGWHGNLYRRVFVALGTGLQRTITHVTRGDGTVDVFKREGLGEYISATGGANRLQPDTQLAGLRYDDVRANAQEVYDAAGRLSRIVWIDGRRLTLSYGDSGAAVGQVVAASDSHGRTLGIEYGDVGSWFLGLPYRFTDPAGATTTLGYGGYQTLDQLTWPDGTRRRFQYHQLENPAWTLTGIVDEADVQYASFGYDSTGHAISSEHAGGVGRYTTSYGVPPGIAMKEQADDQRAERTWKWTPPQDVVVTQPNGAVQRWSSTSLNGHNFLQSLEQPGGSGTGAAVSAQTYDEQGNLASRDSFNGRRACYQSDTGRSLETTRVEGLDTQAACSSATAITAVLPAGARKTSTRWHPEWSVRSQVAEPGRITTNVYNGQPDPSQGNAVAACAPAGAVLPDGKPIVVLCKQRVQATTDVDGHLGFSASAQPGSAARVTRWTYNQDGQVLSVRGTRADLDDSSSFGYYGDTNADHTHGDLQSITDARGQVTRFDRYNRYGQVLQSTDPNGIVTVNTYDARQRLLSRTVVGAVGSETTSYTYDPVGQLTRVTEGNGTWVGMAYDAAHRRTAVSDSDGNRIDYALDNAGEAIGETVHDPSGVLVRSLARVMDALGRLQQETRPGDASLYGEWAQGAGQGTGQGSPSGWVPLAAHGENFEATRVWRVRYGADTRWAEREVYGLTPCNHLFFGDPAPFAAKSCQRYVGAAPPPLAVGATVSRYEYDGEGNLTRQTLAPDGLNLQTQLSYDALERVQDSTDAKGGRTSLQYDGGDQVTQVTDPRNLSTQYVRNGLGETTQLISADTGAASHTYDEAGNLTSRTDSRGVLERYGYDALNRLVTASYTQGGQGSQSGQTSQALSWGWDLTGAGYANGIGRLGRSEHPDGSARWQYDALGRVTQAVQTVNAAAAGNSAALTTAVQYGYTQGRLTSITYPSGRQLGIGYGGRRIGSLSLAQSTGTQGQALLDEIRWEPFGAARGWKWAMASGALAQERYRDQGGRLVRYTLGENYRDVSYDEALRITGFRHVNAADGMAQPALDQSFGYDENSRLTSIVTNAASWSIGYDPNGNRTGVSLNGSLSAYNTEPTSNRLLGTSNPARSLGYDNAGNTTSDSAGNGAGYTATYNLRGQLATLTKAGVTTTYTYDADGRRVRKVSSTGAASTVVFVYDLQGQLLGEYDRNGAALREYVWLENTPVAMFTPDPANPSGAPLVYYLHTDHLDAPRIVVDRNNQVRWRWLAEPFGTTAAETNPGGLGVFTQNLRFPGQYADQESGLFYNYHRYYSPEGGDYRQSDPIGLAGGSLSTYSYAESDPLRMIDPLGLMGGGGNHARPRPRACVCSPIAIASAAASHDQEPGWGKPGWQGGPGWYLEFKCNKFVNTAVTESGSSPPLVNGRLATAGEIADPNLPIENWQVVSGPMEPGDVLAIGHAGEGYTGHTGLYVNNGKVASASDITGRVEVNNWGLRPGQTPTIRRCICAQ